MMFNVVRINPVAVPHASSPLFLLNWCLSLSVIHKPAQICLPWCILHISHRSGDLYSESRKPRGSTGSQRDSVWVKRLWTSWAYIPEECEIQCGSSKDVHCLCLKLWNWQTLADRYPAWGAMGAIAMGACCTATRGVAGCPAARRSEPAKCPNWMSNDFLWWNCRAYTCI